MTKVAMVVWLLVQRATPTETPWLNRDQTVEKWFDQLLRNPVFWVIVVVALVALVFWLWRLGGGKYDKEI